MGPRNAFSFLCYANLGLSRSVTRAYNHRNTQKDRGMGRVSHGAAPALPTKYGVAQCLFNQKWVC
jgi:hypothetical protein